MSTKQLQDRGLGFNQPPGDPYGRAPRPTVASYTGVRAATGYVYGASECRYCDPAKSITEWSVKDGYTYTGESMPDDCLADDTTTDTTDSGDSPDRTTAASGGTLSESDGAQALVAGALAPLAALLL